MFVADQLAQINNQLVGGANPVSRFDYFQYDNVGSTILGGKMKTLITILSLILCATLCSAEGTGQQRELAEQLFRVLKADKQYEQIRAPADVDPVMGKLVAGQVSQTSNWEKLKDKYIDAYIQYFSEKDLAKLVEFFSSPTGQKYIENQEKLYPGGMELIMAMVADKEQLSPEEVESRREVMGNFLKTQSKSPSFQEQQEKK